MTTKERCPKHGDDRAHGCEECKIIEKRQADGKAKRVYCAFEECGNKLERGREMYCRKGAHGWPRTPSGGIIVFAEQS